jgi:signal transduction histidine kinase
VPSLPDVRSGARPRPRDVAIAAVVAFVQVAGTTVTSRHQPGARPLDALAYALLLAGPALLLVRRRWKDGVLLAVFAVVVAWWAADYPGGPIFLSLVVAFFTAALRRRWPAYGVLALGYVLGAVALPWVRTGSPWSTAAAGGLGAWLLVLLVAAEGARQRLAALAAARQREEEQRRSRAEAQRRRASEERLEIARELHDVIGHSLSMINVQAGVALELFPTRPEMARESLAAIKTASRDALVEVHAVLDSLRSGADAAPRSPSATVTDLDTLVDRARGAGLRVTTRVDGEPRPLPTRVDLVAARIVVEGLTNVARHAGGAAAEVVVRYGAEELVVTVDDDGRTAATGGPVREGRGIPGMRERVQALGGTLSAGFRPDGGFRVEASLPLGPVEQGGERG